MPPGEWPAAEPIETGRLVLEPLRPEHAEEMAPLLDDERLHRFIGGEPLGVEQLRERYARLVVGAAPDGSVGWCNWIVRDRAAGVAVGSVQATLRPRKRGLSAEIAWVVATVHQGRGYATEAAGAMVAWLQTHGVGEARAHIHPRHGASIAVAERLGLAAAADAAVGRERVWRRALNPP